MGNGLTPDSGRGRFGRSGFLLPLRRALDVARAFPRTQLLRLPRVLVVHDGVQLLDILSGLRQQLPDESGVFHAALHSNGGTLSL